MSRPLTHRQAAEAIEQFGEDLKALVKDFDRLVGRMPGWYVDVVNDIHNQEHLDTIAEAFRAAGDHLCRKLDEQDDAATLDRANPLEPDFRRLGV